MMVKERIAKSSVEAGAQYPCQHEAEGRHSMQLLCRYDRVFLSVSQFRVPSRTPHVDLHGFVALCFA